MNNCSKRPTPASLIYRHDILRGNETKLKDAMLDALKDKAPKETESEEEQVDDN